MLSETPFLDELEERWSEIIEFPGYSVSDQGRVLNDRMGVLLKQTKNSRGIPIVGLMKDGVQHKRSVSVLVANAFVSRVMNDNSFDTPINLNGDREDNRYSNLAWRPLWFARKYNRQFVDNHPTFEAPIEDVETNEVYQSSMHASITNGVLDYDIYLSMLNNEYVWPTGQVFRELND